MDLSELDQSVLIRIIVICIISFLLLQLINLIFKNPEKIHLKFLRSFLKVLLAIFSIYFILENFSGFEKFSSTILTSSSLIVVVLGFAFQTSLGDVIAGIFLSVFKPFDVNDRITLKSQNITGIVEDITIRHTVIRTFTNSRLIIPNSVMNQEVIENNHIADVMSSHFMDVTVAYDTDIPKAKKIIAECIESHPDTINPEGGASSGYTYVYTREFLDSGIDLRASVWTEVVDINFRVCSEVRDSIIEAFRANDIEIPYNHVTVVYPKDKKEIK